MLTFQWVLFTKHESLRCSVWFLSWSSTAKDVTMITDISTNLTYIICVCCLMAASVSFEDTTNWVTITHTRLILIMHITIIRLELTGIVSVSLTMTWDAIGLGSTLWEHSTRPWASSIMISSAVICIVVKSTCIMFRASTVSWVARWV